jgi:hypothetical protein
LAKVLVLKILIAGYYSAFWHEGAWARALRELDHEVIEFPFKDYFANGLLGRLQNRLLVGPAVAKVNQDLIHCVENTRPDIVVCYRALPLSVNTIKRLALGKASPIMICYNNDNAFGELSGKAYWRLFKDAIPYYDLHLAYRDSDVAHLGKDTNSYVLHPHNMPWLHRVLPENELAGWESDICFLGHFEPDRRKNELDTLMKKVPAHYRLHGSFWKENSKGMAWQGMDTKELQGEDYVRALNATKIALVFFSTWNADTFTRRVFEIPACGTMMLSQRTETMQGLYTEDKEAVYFDNADELVDKASFYLKHDDARKRIAEAGRLRCISSGYDIYSRMREWLSVVESMKSKASQ